MKFIATFIFVIMSLVGVVYGVISLVPNGVAQFCLIIAYLAAVLEMSRK